LFLQIDMGDISSGNTLSYNYQRLQNGLGYLG
jgi:hypothetical protein